MQTMLTTYRVPAAAIEAGEIARSLTALLATRPEAVPSVRVEYLPPVSRVTVARDGRRLHQAARTRRVARVLVWPTFALLAVASGNAVGGADAWRSQARAVAPTTLQVTSWTPPVLPSVWPRALRGAETGSGRAMAPQSQPGAATTSVAGAATE
jgi:hypothetical protein